ncbi:hypothetical protein EI427_16445 [Flammeovirga pectinis]|uniref:Uncharacterized protein n=1 Tax=Flammeovirga pectinis TaxID=2494373 RepID=A0A3Q9FQ14_9BACT|nr:hypothetical protein [Flammeovirga pectinis]AZQ63756.1 hypothetical protein EI427_16445 [Flammeovirga pectinis]
MKIGDVVQNSNNEVFRITGSDAGSINIINRVGDDQHFGTAFPDGLGTYTVQYHTKVSSCTETFPDERMIINVDISGNVILLPNICN